MSLVKKISLDSICAPIRPELKIFTQRLEKELSSQDELIRNIHGHLLKMTGKFMRPMMAILCSRIEDKKPDQVIPLAVAIELMHTATLVHDDIIDESEFRRNQLSIHSKWGREISIVSGDYLYAKAFMLLAEFEDTRIGRSFAACAHLMCEGEMKQIESRSHFLMSEADYFDIIHKKTAALFHASCLGGAYFSGASFENIERLGRYGDAIGMAFQIVDDCLDLVGKTETLGKKAGLDIHKKEVTLPLLYLFGDLSEPERQALTSDMRSVDAAAIERLKRLAVEKKAVWRAMQKAQEFIDLALKELEPFADSPYKDSLRHLTDHCLDRVR